MTVKVGQRLEERQAPHRLWEIVRIIRPESGLPHAWLRLARDRRTTMMLSCAELESGETFREPEEAHAGR